MGFFYKNTARDRELCTYDKQVRAVSDKQVNGEVRGYTMNK